MGDLAKDINSKFKNNRIKALLNIIYTANWINNCQNEFFKPFGISPQQYNILRILNGANEALNVQTIKDRMLERSPNATRLMDKLCAKNYIQRLPSEHDRRVVEIKITQEGKNLLKSIPNNLNNDLLKNISEAEAKQLSDLLDKLR
ncbi:MarR family winged helix-turn-helix transcriptional regulator [uncultured Winogradskyella sp.]|uniref:MarR family winged helix-turn-helix transcriptional regulator n=1 Tax=uncultured Winogradskyella sp. TaxID=395353 RepID=UPI00351685CC